MHPGSSLLSPSGTGVAGSRDTEDTWRQEALRGEISISAITPPVCTELALMPPPRRGLPRGLRPAACVAGSCTGVARPHSQLGPGNKHDLGFLPAPPPQPRSHAVPTTVRRMEPGCRGSDGFRDRRTPRREGTVGACSGPGPQEISAVISGTHWLSHLAPCPALCLRPLSRTALGAGRRVRRESNLGWAGLTWRVGDSEEGSAEPGRCPVCIPSGFG